MLPHEATFQEYIERYDRERAKARRHPFFDTGGAKPVVLPGYRKSFLIKVFVQAMYTSEFNYDEMMNAIIPGTFRRFYDS
jgi:hypothetical protein